LVDIELPRPADLYESDLAAPPADAAVAWRGGELPDVDELLTSGH